MGRAEPRIVLPVLFRSILFFALLLGTARADTVRVAVAANFRAPLEVLAREFTKARDHELVISAGSTGQLHAQIVNGAPFDVFLAADQARPQTLVDAGLADPDSRFTYAVGRLVAISLDSRLLHDTGPHFSRFRTLSIANPRTAPYGAAALQVFEALGAPEWIRVAEAQSVAGVNAAVRTGAADVGFAALSTVLPGDQLAHWVVPPGLYDPIRQDAVLLMRGAANPAARAFMDWLAGDTARGVIQRHGYDLD